MVATSFTKVSRNRGLIGAAVVDAVGRRRGVWHCWWRDVDVDGVNLSVARRGDERQAVFVADELGDLGIDTGEVLSGIRKKDAAAGSLG